MDIIRLENTKNTRTLSNLKNKKGLSIQKNMLLRSDALDKINSNDQKILCKTYSLKRIIDLRTENEVKNNPDVTMDGVCHYFNPILENERLGVSKKGKAESDIMDLVFAIKEKGLDNSDLFMQKIYTDILESSFANQSYSNFLKLLLEEVDGSTLWHCSAGKDRAGFATILVLYILEFDLNTILQDYLSTNLYYAKTVEDLAIQYGEDFKPVLWSVFGVKESYFKVLIDSILNRFGSFDAYIEEVLQFSKEQQVQLRRIYLGEKNGSVE